jgi:hypothetical protein
MSHPRVAALFAVAAMVAPYLTGCESHTNGPRRPHGTIPRRDVGKEVLTKTLPDYREPHSSQPIHHRPDNKPRYPDDEQKSKSALPPAAGVLSAPPVPSYVPSDVTPATTTTTTTTTAAPASAAPSVPLYPPPEPPAPAPAAPAPYVPPPAQFSPPPTRSSNPAYSPPAPAPSGPTKPEGRPALK